jgi:diguanylate cyclase (GGDEF)-like protein
MMPSSALPSPSQQPDTRIAGLLTALQRIVLGTIAAIAAVALFAWMLPPLGRLLPLVWMLMSPATLGCALLGALSMTLSQSGRSPRCMTLSRIFSVMVTAVATACLLEDIYGGPASSAAMPFTHPMNAPVALTYLLLGVVLCCLRETRGTIAVFADLVTVCEAMLMLVLTSSYLFGSGQAFASEQHRIAPETLIVLLCLSFALFSRRAEFGAFSILLESGIGGVTARMAAPMAIGLPLVMGLIQIGGVSSGLLTPAFATAVVTSILSVVAFCLVLVLARRAGRLETEINELSLRDPLTGLYNRRSFHLLAEHALRQAHRADEPFSVLYIDLDGLGAINDARGFPAGSEMLQRLASHLTQNFREADVVARLAGDKFVVAGRASAPQIAVATYRLLQMAAVSNERLADQKLDQPALSFSFGHFTSDHSSPFTLEAMLQKAEASMQDSKRGKPAGQGLRGVPSIVRDLRPVHDRA